MSSIDKPIPLMKPLLPNRCALSPYLAEIDANRWYSNFGPLERRFEKQLAEHFSLAERQVVCTSSGTQALGISIKSAAQSPIGYCVMPAFTFVATAHAAVAAGLEPYFVDVDRETWALDPNTVLRSLPQLDAPVAAVIAVAPFGAAIDAAAWDTFHKSTGIPVLIDAAAGFDTVKCGSVPVIISLHATKVFGIGEGGVVLCQDERLAELIRAGRNFGFMGERAAETQGTNAKLSEYAAAVGLAAYSLWCETRAAYRQIALMYAEVFAGMKGFAFAPGFSGDSALSTCNILLEKPIARDVIATLAGQGIEARQWWNLGCHNEPIFARCKKESLEVTDFLCGRIVGLPFYRGLEIYHIERIRACLECALPR